MQASASQSPEEREQFQQDILALGNEILDRDYSELRPVPLAICPECDFLPRCLRYWNEQQRSEIFDGGFSDDGL